MQLWNSLRIDGSHQFRLAHHNLTIGPPNPHALTYESRVVRVLRQIHSNAAGAILLQQIGSVRGRVTTIRPLVREFQSITSPVSPLRSMVAGIPAYNEAGLARDHGQVIFGLGGGSDVRIFFSPETFSHGLAGTTPDAVLCHELFHALRSMQGRQQIRPTFNRYEEYEEFWAVMIENIYLSMGGHVALRVSHHTFRDMPSVPGVSPDSVQALFRRDVLGLFGDDIMDNPFQAMSATTGPSLSQRFARDNRTLIHSLMRSESELCRCLAALPCSFNPIRDLPH